MPKFPIGIVLKLVPALTEALGGLIAATRKDSDGGKKITKAEAEEIADELLADLRPVVLAEVVKQLDVVD